MADCRNRPCVASDFYNPARFLSCLLSCGANFANFNENCKSFKKKVPLVALNGAQSAICLHFYTINGHCIDIMKVAAVAFLCIANLCSKAIVARFLPRLPPVDGACLRRETAAYPIKTSITSSLGTSIRYESISIFHPLIVRKPFWYILGRGDALPNSSPIKLLGR